MEWLWGAIVKLLGLGGKGAKDAIVAYDRFAARLTARMEVTEKRLDECDEDRRELRNELAAVRDKQQECDEHRSSLQEEVTSLKTKVSTLEQKTQ